MIVVDTNILSYFYLSSAYSNVVERLFKTDPDWAAPALWRSEFRNVLSFYVRKKIVELDQAIDIFEAADQLLRQNEYEVQSFKVLQLSQKSGCSAYDCEFVSLAQDLNLSLITMDKKILRSFPNIAVSPASFALD